MNPHESNQEGAWIPTYCFQCNAGPDLVRVLNVNGVAVKVEGNPDFADQDPAGARICV